MQLDLDALYIGDNKVTVTLEPIGDDKVRVNHASWTDAKVILADQALEVLAVGKRLYLCRGERPAAYLNLDMTGLVDAGYGPVTK
jgi:hypothetical protein